MVSGEQIDLLGFNLRSAERLVNQRSWQRLVTGVYQVHAGPTPWTGLAWAGVLLGGSEARTGFAAAGHLWGLVEDAPQTITVLVPHSRPLADRGCWAFRQERPGVRSRRSPGSPPRTTIEDTVVDLCAQDSEGELVGLLSKAVQGRRTTPSRILRCVESRQRLRHRRLLRQLLADVAEGTESPLEVRYLTDVERAHGLPRAVRQVRSRSGREVRDVRYVEYATIVELDGRLHIAGRFKDMRRDNAALLDGDLTLRYGWSDVTERPCLVAAEVARLLSARGWSGSPTMCRRCPPPRSLWMA